MSQLLDRGIRPRLWVSLCLTLFLTSAVLAQGTTDPVVARISFKRVQSAATGNFNPFWSNANINAWLASTNAVFAETGVQFVNSETVNLLDPGGLFNISTSNITNLENLAEAAPATYQWRTDMINIYLCNNITNSTGGGVGGVCSFPGSAHHQEIVVVQPNIANGAVGMAHELGHYFDLYHTHQGAFDNTATCGSPSPNGTSQGDMVCDTPEDPYTTSVSQATNLNNLNILYGACTNNYSALRFNMMSYYQTISVAQCIITEGQRSRVMRAAREERRHVMQAFHQDLRKVMITEVSSGNPDWVEITNFGTGSTTLTNWRCNWREFGSIKTGTPFTITLGPGESAILNEDTTLAGTPPGTQILDVLSVISTSNDFTVALVDASDVVQDEVRVTDTAGVFEECGLGGYFSGLAIRSSSALYVERIWGLDSDSGSDWTSQSTHTAGRQNTSSGPRGTDPRSSWNVVINECDDSPDFVEFRNKGGSSIDLRSWFLHTSSSNLSNHSRIYPWPGSYTVNSGAYFVIGETSTPPTEMPGGTPYVDISQNIPWIGEEYDCALYDCYGRLVDIVRTTGNNDAVVHNNARAPSHWSDFTGSAAREPEASNGGSGAIARRTSTDNDNGSDWVSAFNRTMGSPNPAVNASLAGNDCLMDVVLNGTPGGGGITTIINAGPAFAGYKWSFTYSVNHNQGTGPFYGLGADALPNYLYLSQTPPFFGFLDANGSARLDFNSGTIPVGIDTDDIFILQDPAGNIVAVTDILEFDS